VAGAEGARGTEGGGRREGTGRSCRALWAAGRTWALSQREAGAMGQRRERTDLNFKLVILNSSRALTDGSRLQSQLLRRQRSGGLRFEASPLK
jgi:hypothetical protein